MVIGWRPVEGEQIKVCLTRATDSNSPASCQYVQYYCTVVILVVSYIQIVSHADPDYFSFFLDPDTYQRYEYVMDPDQLTNHADPDPTQKNCMTNNCWHRRYQSKRCKILAF